jgi:hypothetical protein
MMSLRKKHLRVKPTLGFLRLILLLVSGAVAYVDTMSIECRYFICPSRGGHMKREALECAKILNMLRYGET